jgi:hypothetical protein
MKHGYTPRHTNPKRGIGHQLDHVITSQKIVRYDNHKIGRGRISTPKGTYSSYSNKNAVRAQ